MANPKWRRQAKNATSAKILEEMKKSVSNYYFRAEYIDTQIKCFPFFSVFFFISNHFRSSGLPVSHKFKKNITWVFGAIFKIDNIRMFCIN